MDFEYTTLSDSSESCHRGQGDTGVFGDHKCDSPIDLIAETFKQVPKDIDFIIINGDFIRHDKDPKFTRTDEEIIYLHQAIATYLLETFNVPIIVTLGNNDYPIRWKNIHAISPFYESMINRGSIEDTSKLKKYMDESWTIMQDAYSLFKSYGYYQVRLTNALTIISLNTNSFYDTAQLKESETELIRNHTHSKAQLNWVSTVLNELRELSLRTGIQQKAYIIGHVPPHKSFYYPDYYSRWMSITREFSDVIAMQLFGHVVLISMID